MRIVKMMGLALAAAFAVTGAQAASFVPPAAKTASVSVVEQIAAKKAAAKPAKKATKKAAPSKAGKCGVNMYWNKKTKKCADARDKK